MKRLIVTADDFGIASEVNEAVEHAHRGGILTCASLMVTGAAAADAVSRARTMPGLGVGLHVVLVEGVPALPARDIPLLTDRDGRFRNDMVRMAFALFFRPAARRQLAAEIEAQFRAFAETGLTLDHVNAHKHFHLHPVIAATLLRIGRRYGMRAIRAPIEPTAVLDRLERGRGGGIETAWAKRLRTRLRRAGLAAPDHVFGLRWSGGMNEGRMAHILASLPDGVSELYCHPATGPYPGSAAGYAYRDELAALTAQPIADLVARGRIELVTFGAIAG